MSDVNQNEEPQVGREDQTPPSSLDPEIDSHMGAALSEGGESIPEHNSSHVSKRTSAPSPGLIRDSGLWVWIWVIGAVVLIILLIVVLSALPSGSSHRGASEAVRTISALGHHPLTDSGRTNTPPASRSTAAGGSSVSATLRTYLGRVTYW